MELAVYAKLPGKLVKELRGGADTGWRHVAREPAPQPRGSAIRRKHLPTMTKTPIKHDDRRRPACAKEFFVRPHGESRAARRISGRRVFGRSAVGTADQAPARGAFEKSPALYNAQFALYYGLVSLRIASWFDAEKLKILWLN